MDLDNADIPDIGKVARRELANAGYTRLEQFTRVSEKELLEKTRVLESPGATHLCYRVTKERSDA
jgi:hypothetical protein